MKTTQAKWILAAIAAIVLVVGGLSWNWLLGVPPIETGTPQESLSNQLLLSDLALRRQIQAIRARFTGGEIEVDWNRLEGEDWGYYGIRAGNKCVVPGVPEALAMDGTIPVRVITGTDENSSVDGVAELNRIAREYATKYNERFHLWLCTN